MRIPIWKDLRLSVWERQNPDAVQVTLARSAPYQPVRRVLSMRGWMLLFVRYDWKDNSRTPRSDPALVDRLTRELHRRSVRLEELGNDATVVEGVLMNVRGEVLGLQSALGMALGGVAAGGGADKRAYEHYTAWLARQEASR